MNNDDDDDENDNCSAGNKDFTAMKSSKCCSAAFSFIIVKNKFLQYILFPYISYIYLSFIIYHRKEYISSIYFNILIS